MSVGWFARRNKETGKWQLISYSTGRVTSGEWNTKAEAEKARGQKEFGMTGTNDDSRFRRTR